MWVCSPKTRTPRTRRPREPRKHPLSLVLPGARGCHPRLCEGHAAFLRTPPTPRKADSSPPRDSLPLKPFAVSEPLGTSSGPRGAARVKVTAAGAARPAPRCASASEGSRGPGDFIGSPSEMLSRTPREAPGASPAAPAPPRPRRSPARGSPRSRQGSISSHIFPGPRGPARSCRRHRRRGPVGASCWVSAEIFTTLPCGKGRGRAPQRGLQGSTALSCPSRGCHQTGEQSGIFPSHS